MLFYLFVKGIFSLVILLGISFRISLTNQTLNSSKQRVTHINQTPKHLEEILYHMSSNYKLYMNQGWVKYIEIYLRTSTLLIFKYKYKYKSFFIKVLKYKYFSKNLNTSTFHPGMTKLMENNTKLISSDYIGACINTKFTINC